MTPESRMAAPPRAAIPTNAQVNVHHQSSASRRQLASHQVAWWAVYEFAAAVALMSGVNLAADRLAHPGTPAWCELADDDVTKLLSVVLRGVQAALADDAAQADLADAAGEMSRSPQWKTLSQRVAHGRGHAYIPRQKTGTTTP